MKNSLILLKMAKLKLSNPYFKNVGHIHVEDEAEFDTIVLGF